MACKKKYKVPVMKYKQDKCLNKISDHHRCECQYYEQMNMWNGQHANVII